MRIKFTIGRRIGTGFGVLIGVFLISSILFFNTLNKNRELNHQITDIYEPSLDLLSELKLMITNTKQLIGTWIFLTRNDNVPEKQELRKIHQEIYPDLKNRLKELSKQWTVNERNAFDTISMNIDSLFSVHQTVMKKLNSFESYSDPLIIFILHPMMDQEGVITVLTNKVNYGINRLMKQQEDRTIKARTEMFNSLNNFKNFILVMGIIILLAGIIIAFYTIQSITKPIKYFKTILLKMGKGNQPDEIITYSKDEIGEMSEALKILNDGLKETSSFAKKIGAGQLDAQFKPLSDEDILGNSLLEMRKSLKMAAEEEEKRKEEDNKRNWAIKGLALFGDILRKNNDDIEVLANDIISNLVKYTESNQGALYLLNNENTEEPTIEMIACYAWNKKKHFLNRQIPLGEDLAGQCVLDKETIYLTDVPDNYVFIKSGLGGENPRSIILVPLKLNDEVYGVIELASFKVFEDYVVDFVEKVGVSIASTVSSVKINMKTAFLLEQSQMQAEEMKAQEEEMRQNMEELAATQEAMEEKERQQREEIAHLKLENEERLEQLIKQAENFKMQDEAMKKQFHEVEKLKLEVEKKAKEFEWHLKCVNKTLILLEYNFDGNIVFVNDLFCQRMGYTSGEILGKHHSIFFDNKDFLQSKAYQKFWEDMRAGKTFEGIMARIDKNGNKIIVKGVCSAMFDHKGNPVKVMEFLTDITDQTTLLEQTKQQAEAIKSHEEELLQNMEKLRTLQDAVEAKATELEYYLKCINKTMILLEYDLDGNIVYANDLFCQRMGYELNEIIGQHYSLFFDNKDIAHSKAYQKFWNIIKGGKTFEGVMAKIDKNGNKVIVKVVSSAMFDKKGNPVKVMEFLIDITDQSQLLEQTKQQAEELKKQEEEMLQNMEKLKTIQENLQAKEKKLLQELKNKLDETLEQNAKLEALKKTFEDREKQFKIIEKRLKSEIQKLKEKQK